MEKKILIVDDEKPIVDVLKFNLEKDGYKTIEAYDGEQAVEMALTAKPDLIILDVMLPKMDGFTVCKKLRPKLTCPIIMLTAKEDVVDKIIGLELGADDYMTKPFSVRELAARVKANLRKHVVEETVGEKPEQNALKIKDIVLDLEKYVVIKKNGIIDLTMKEFEVVKLLASNPGQVFTREQILKNVWGYDYYGDVRSVDVTIRRIREKIEDNTSDPKYIITKRGIGYYV
ncbi:MAG: response regulator transcription factor [Clostridia bacterium]|nr:response regulator transcription factor [Clostridia bacterium]